MSKINVDVFGGIAGEYYYSFEGMDKHIAQFVEKCARAGVKRFIPNFQISAFRSHPWVICTKPFSYGEIEARGFYQGNEYGPRSPLVTLVKRAHEHGVEVHPYIHVPLTGIWFPKGDSPVHEFIPLGYMTQFSFEHPEFCTKNRDGLSFMDTVLFGERVGYGYLGFAYPEVRAYETSLCAEMVGYYGTDGVTLEFVPNAHVDDKGVCTLGYDEPALQQHREKYGSDPRHIPNDNEAWIRLRASYVTQFMSELRVECNKAHPGSAIIVFETGGAADPDTAYRKLLDWPAWMQDGLLDVFYPMLFLEGSFLIHETADSGRIKQVVANGKAVAKDHCKMYAMLEIQADKSRVVELIRSGARAAVEAGADGIGVYRADWITKLELWDTVKDIVQGNL